jgi:hypothetical protein
MSTRFVCFLERTNVLSNYYNTLNYKNMTNPKLKEIAQPVTEIPENYYQPGKEIFQNRLSRLYQLMEDQQYDALVIYADREHAANFQYLMNFEPRFEEALLLLLPGQKPKAFLGNECQGLNELNHIEAIVEAFLSLSLVSQPRNGKKIKEILKNAGLKNNMKTGIAGWKYFTEADGMKGAFETPFYLVSAIQNIVGEANVRNATALFMAPGLGLRTNLEAAQIVQYEYHTSICSNRILNVINSIKPGVSEFEIGSLMNSQGIPLCCHPMISFGDKARLGLSSPGPNIARKGDFSTTCMGLVGALTSRCAYIAMDNRDLAPSVNDWSDKVAAPYFHAAACWLENLHIGTEGGKIFNTINTVFPAAEYGWLLNPGHYIAYDEWVSSPITPESQTILSSGTYLQLDLIPDPEKPYFGANIEDGYVLADLHLREEIRANYPDTFQRFERRKKYMKESIGIDLPEEVLPMSDIAGYYRPYLLNRNAAFVMS